MKPLHAEKRRLSRCKCCQSKGTKRNGKRAGKATGRQAAAKDLQRRVSE